MANGYSVPDIADAVEDALRAEADRYDREQSVRGLDALDELSLHPVLAEGLGRAGFGVYPEQHYPTSSLENGDSCLQSWQAGQPASGVSG